jgi:imidazolonepropionase-like amidohydrolase
MRCIVLLAFIFGVVAWPRVGRADDAPIIVHAAHVFDGEKLLGPSYILVAKGHIAKISSTPPANAGARLIELPGMTVMSGLIDVHVHLLLPDGTPPSQGRVILLSESSAQKALRGLRAAQRLLDAGFTTLRDPGDFDVARAHLDVRDAINSGLFVGPKIYAADRFLTRTGGHYDDNWVAPDQHVAPWARVADGPAELVKAVREEVKAGADWIKLAGSGGFSTPGSLPELSTFTDEELHAIVTEAHRLKRKVAAHAHSGPALAAVIRAGVDSIEHGTALSADQLREMARRHIAWVPTIYDGDAYPAEHDRWLTEWRKERDVPALKRQFKAALDAGVSIVFGTDSGLFPHGDCVRMLALLVESGLRPIEALRAATVNAAKLLGDDEAGRIAPGQRADLIAVAGDPLENVRLLESVKFVMVRGAVVRGAPAP